MKKLLNIKFSSLPFNEKMEIINLRRHCPTLKMSSREKTYERKFHSEIYNRKVWLCGCPEKDKLFCFPCLLFNKTKTAWNKEGYDDLKHLSNAIQRHERSKTHIQSIVALRSFGSTRIDTLIDHQLKEAVSAHNQKVKENREILRSFIKAACYLAKQELAFRESDPSVNKGNYLELINVLSEDDYRLASHLESSTVFKGTSNRIQNDLISSIATVIRKNIAKEVSETMFVSIDADETTDISRKAQFSIVLRYLRGDEIIESFIGFIDISADRSAKSMADVIKEKLSEYECTNKVISQTYDGCSAMSSAEKGVHGLIKHVIPESIFVHCYSHKLNLVLLQSTRRIDRCNIFFSTLDGLSAFFSHSVKRTHLLDEMLQRRFPRSVKTRWTSHSKVVTVVENNLELLIDYFKTIINSPSNWDKDTIVMALCFLKFLQTNVNVFLLLLFRLIFREIDSLYSILQTQTMNIPFCIKRIEDCAIFLDSKRSDFDTFYLSFVDKCKIIDVDLVPSRTQSNDSLRFLYFEVFDNIKEHLKRRYQDIHHLDFFRLLDGTIFRDSFDSDLFNKLRALYPTKFDRLKSDLIGLYNTSEFHDKSICELFSFFHKIGIMDALPEVYKLLSLCMTIPATSVHVERSFSALKRVKSFSRNRTSSERLSDLGIIAIEKERLGNLQRRPDFYDLVTDEFLKKDRRMDFIYK